MKDDPVQVGAIMIENSTGKILSFIGGRDHSQEATNHATQAYRQNGSSMKPLLVFAPAIEYGVIGAGSPVVDVKFNVRHPTDPTGHQVTTMQQRNSASSRHGKHLQNH